MPPGGPGIRVCSSCHTGHVVSPHYDSLIAKLMCKGANRGESVARMKRALEEFIIEGVDTTVPFHKVVLDCNEFMKGETTTNFILKNNIMDKLVKSKVKKSLSKKEKLLIVTTAVSQYMSECKDDNSAWVKAGRTESMFEENV